eukprot:gene6645-4764_t
MNFPSRYIDDDSLIPSSLLHTGTWYRIYLALDHSAFFEVFFPPFLHKARKNLFVREKERGAAFMGQGLGAGTLIGACASMAAAPAKLSAADHLLIASSGAAAGLATDFASDCFARQGKVIIQRDVLRRAQDVLRHVYTFYAPCEANKAAALLRQKHEWLVLESHSQCFYTVQKAPGTGNIHMDVRLSLRAANDLGLLIAKRPLQTGEVRQHRADMEFDLPSDVPVAYMIAWLRKEEPRWSLTTENSRHFATKVRYALNDF